ncbi:hypothetical protein ES708_31103 [subsurface metagenome]
MHDKETPQGLPNHNLEDENLSLPVDDLISKKTVKGEGCHAEIPKKWVHWRGGRGVQVCTWVTICKDVGLI